MSKLTSLIFRPDLLLVLLFSCFTSCSKEKVASEFDESSKASVSAAVSKLTLYSWGEYFSEELLARFSEESGIDVEYEVYDTSDEMREHIKSNPDKYDVVVMDDLALHRMQRIRVIRKLNQNMLPNFVHIDKKYLPEHDGIRGGLHYSIPYFWGTTVVAYNKEHVSEPEQSWKLLFDPKVKDHVFLVKERMECIENILRHLGLSPATEQEDDLRQAGSKLSELVYSQRAKFGSDADGKEGLLDGSIWAAMIYNGDLAQALEKDTSGKIGYFYPREGTTTWVDNFTIPRDTPRWKEAHQFINFMMDPVVAAESSLYVRFATANLSARKHLAQLDAELLEGPVFSDGESVGSTLTEGSMNRQRLIHEIWESNVEKAIEERDGTGALSSSGDDEEE